jgi:hypothetical protein
MWDRAAYTEKPDLTGTGWAVTLCSQFFQGRYLKTITEGTQSKQLNNLISYEHTLVHEFMVSLTCIWPLDLFLITLWDSMSDFSAINMKVSTLLIVQSISLR